MGHFGFSWLGLVYLLMLFLPNIAWSRVLPEGYDPSDENRALVVLERVGQIGCTFCALFFTDFDPAPLSPWSAWLAASLALMILYEICWARHFKNGGDTRSMYGSFLKIPVPLASLPVTAFLLLGIYGRVIWMVISAALLGIGHIGIHIDHWRKLNNIM